MPRRNASSMTPKFVTGTVRARRVRIVGVRAIEIRVVGGELDVGLQIVGDVVVALRVELAQVLFALQREEARVVVHTDIAAREDADRAGLLERRGPLAVDVGLTPQRALGIAWKIAATGGTDDGLTRVEAIRSPCNQCPVVARLDPSGLSGRRDRRAAESIVAVFDRDFVALQPRG